MSATHLQGPDSYSFVTEGGSRLVPMSRLPARNIWSLSPHTQLDRFLSCTFQFSKHSINARKSDQMSTCHISDVPNFRRCFVVDWTASVRHCDAVIVIVVVGKSSGCSAGFTVPYHILQVAHIPTLLYQLTWDNKCLDNRSLKTN